MRKKILRAVDKNRKIFAIFSIILSVLILVGSTYAWVTYSDERVNRTIGNSKKLSAEINEEFTPNLSWAPDEETKKKLLIENTGEMPNIVRISFYEFLAHFEINMEDGTSDNDGKNGGIKSYNEATADLLDINNVQTWQEGNFLKVSSSKYFKVAYIYKSNKLDNSTAYRYESDTKNSDALNYIKINFDKLYTKDTIPQVINGSYWYYSDGYFYYSEILSPKDKSSYLIKSVKLSADLPNKYKGTIYQLIPVMEAHDISNTLLDDWGISSSTDSHLKTMYADKLQ